MTVADQHPQGQPASLPQELAALVRHMAIQRIRKGNALLWSGGFPMPGMGNDVSMEVTRDLELRVRNRVTNEVFMQTEPVQFGALAQGSTLVEEKFEAWMRERGHGVASPVDEQPSVEGSQP